MDPKTQQVNQTVPQESPQASQPAGQNATVKNTQGGGNKKLLVYGALIGLVVIVLIGIAGYYFIYSPKNTNDMVAVPTQAPVAEAEEAPITDASELDSIILELTTVDEALAEELETLETESNF